MNTRMMAAAPLHLRTFFEESLRLPPFFTGGPTALTANDLILTPCANEVHVFNVRNGPGSDRITLKTDSPVIALAVPPEGQHALVATMQAECCIFNLESGECIQSWKPHGQHPVSALACGPAGLIATAAGRSVRVWDRSGSCTHSFPLGCAVTTLAFHHGPNALHLHACCDDLAVRVFDLLTSSLLHTLASHVSLPTCVAPLYLDHRPCLVSGGRDGVLCFWDLQPRGSKDRDTGKGKANGKGRRRGAEEGQDPAEERLLRTLPVYEPVESVCVLRSDIFAAHKKTGGDLSGVAHVLVGLATGELRLLRVEASQAPDTQRLALETRQIGALQDVLPSLHQMFVQQKSGVEPYAIAVTREHTFFSIAIPSLTVQHRRTGFLGEVIDARLLADENRVLLATNCEELRILSLENMSFEPLAGHRDIILSVDLSPCGRFAVSSAKDNSVRLWDLHTRRCLAEGQGHIASVSAVAFHRCAKPKPGAPGPFVVSGSEDKTLKLWDIAEHLQAAVSSAPAKSRKRGRSAAQTELPGEVQRLAPTCSQLAHDKDINAVAVAPNDSLIATASQDKTIKLWNRADLSLVATLRGHRRGVWSVAFSPVDRVVLSSSGDRTIRIWSLSDHSCIRTFEGHTGSVLQACFATRGTQVFSTGSEGLLKIWAVKTGECLQTLEAHEDRAWALACGQDGDSILTGGADGAVAVYRDRTLAKQEEADQLEEEKLLQAQDLQTALRRREYRRAFHLALGLDQPQRIRSVLEAMLAQGESPQAVIQDLSEEHLSRVLLYAVNWNTNARTCHVAHYLMHCVLRCFQPEALLKLPKFKEVIEGFLPYTERHIARLDRMQIQSHILQFTCDQVNAAFTLPFASGDEPARAENAFMRMLVDLPSEPPPEEQEAEQEAEEEALMAIEEEGQEQGEEEESKSGMVQPTPTPAKAPKKKKRAKRAKQSAPPAPAPPQGQQAPKTPAPTPGKVIKQTPKSQAQTPRKRAPKSQAQAQQSSQAPPAPTQGKQGPKSSTSPGPRKPKRKARKGKKGTPDNE